MVEPKIAEHIQIILSRNGLVVDGIFSTTTKSRIVDYSTILTHFSFQEFIVL